MADTTNPPPIVLTIAGSDSSGGAGIQADLKTFTALGVYGASAVTALTAQNTQGVREIHPVPTQFVRAQIDAVAEDLNIAAVKIGMLATSAIISETVAAINAHNLAPVVVDPVMVSTSGDPLLEPQAIDALTKELLPVATIITPNLDEAALLLGETRAGDEQAMKSQARALLRMGCNAVLLKGGHALGTEAVDLLATPEGITVLSDPAITTNNTHGTGCTLSAALATYLALGQDLPDAASQAKAFVWKALKSGAGFNIGQGCGPIDHLHAIRRKI